MKSYQIYIIRHGMTAENAKGAYIGTTDVPLSAEGAKKLEKYANELKYPGTPMLYSSPLLRCIQTCNFLYPAIKPIVINDFSECSFGDWEGKTAKDLSKNPLFVSWLANSKEISPPNGESGQSFTKRICLAFEKLVNDLIKSGETTAVLVTHGVAIMTLLSIYGLPQAEAYRWQLDNGFGYALRITPILWMRDKVVEVYDRIPKGNEQ
ncbi:phosphoglycerate mutase [Clostridia bacterium]|nr:phosphoglycerate mutase [Clostridia bacterium]